MNREIVIALAPDAFRSWLARTLEREGFEVELAYDAPDADELLARAPAMVILDIDHDSDPDAGFRVCAELRLRAPGLLIVFLTDSDYECDRISAFRVGADEFLTKKASGLFLAVRLAALFRRRDTLAHNGNDNDAPHIIRCGQLVIDTNDWEATWRGESLDLSMTRLKILKRLAELPGQVCTPQDLMAAAGIQVEPNTVTAHIKEIRNAFRETDPEFEHIRSERSVGYRWVSH